MYCSTRATEAALLPTRPAIATPGAAIHDFMNECQGDNYKRSNICGASASRIIRQTLDGMFIQIIKIYIMSMLFL